MISQPQCIHGNTRGFCRICNPDYFKWSDEQTSLRTDYTVQVNGKTVPICKRCGDSIDENGFCYCCR